MKLIINMKTKKQRTQEKKDREEKNKKINRTLIMSGAVSNILHSSNYN